MNIRSLSFALLLLIAFSHLNAQIQPKLVVTKTANKNIAGFGNQVTYNIRIKNVGNTASLGYDEVFDTLDVATDYSPGSFSATRYFSGVPTNVTGTGITLISTINDLLHFRLVNP